MDTKIFNSKKNKISDPHRSINLSDKINLKRSNKYVAVPNHSM